MSGYADKLALAEDTPQMRVLDHRPGFASYVEKERALADRALTALAPLLIELESRRFGTTPDTALSASRKAEDVAVRRAVAKALRVVCRDEHRQGRPIGLPVAAIGRILGGRDHSTVCNALAYPCRLSATIRGARRYLGDLSAAAPLSVERGAARDGRDARLAKNACATVKRYAHVTLPEDGLPPAERLLP